MFDTHHHGPRSMNVNSRTEVTEKRAPTDESVRLLSEMEKAAEKKLISVTRLDNNEFKATWHTFEDHANFQLRAVCRYELNGVAHQFEIPIERHLRFKPQDIAQEIHKAVIAELAKLLTIELFTSNQSTIANALR